MAFFIRSFTTVILRFLHAFTFSININLEIFPNIPMYHSSRTWKIKSLPRCKIHLVIFFFFFLHNLASETEKRKLFTSKIFIIKSDDEYKKKKNIQRCSLILDTEFICRFYLNLSFVLLSVAF